MFAFTSARRILLLFDHLRSYVSEMSPVRGHMDVCEMFMIYCVCKTDFSNTLFVRFLQSKCSQISRSLTDIIKTSLCYVAVKAADSRQENSAYGFYETA